MTLEPYFQESPVVQAHAAVAVLALIVGAVQFFRKKGDPVHRAVGWAWVVLMATVAISGLFIWQIRLWWLFSPIHLLSLFALAMLWHGVRAAQRGNIRTHMRTMRATYVFALLITGLLTFVPGRTMYRIAFGPEGATPLKVTVFAAILSAIVVAVVVVIRWRETRQGRAFVAAH